MWRAMSACRGLATDEGAAGTSHSIPVLGYYGSWSEPSMYDVGSLIDSIYGTETRAPYLGDEQLWHTPFPTS